MKNIIPIILLIFVYTVKPLFPQKYLSSITSFSKKIESQADSILNTLSFEEKIGQSLMVYGYSDKGIRHEIEIIKIINKYKIGGLVLFPGEPEKQAELINFYQSQSLLPLLIASSNKNGPGLRFENVIEFPFQMSMGAVQNDSLIYQQGIELAKQYKRMGINMKMLRFSDINSDLDNAATFMKGIRDSGILATVKYFPGFLSGINLLVFPEDLPATITKIKKAVSDGFISVEDIENRCRMMLKHKIWCGLDHYGPVKTENILEDLNSLSARNLKYKLIENSVTLLKNRNRVIPVKRLDTTKIATIFLGSNNLTEFQKTCSKYTQTTNFNWTEYSDTNKQKEILQKLDSFNLIIAGAGNLSKYPHKNYGISNETIDFLKQLLLKEKVILTIFGSPYVLEKLQKIEKSEAIIIAYNKNKLVQKISSQVIFGGTSANGRLPVNVNSTYQLGDGLETDDNLRLKYSFPGYAGLDKIKLHSVIDSIANSGIREKAFPGCQVLVARKGSVIFHKTYGYHTFKKHIPEKKDDLYDLASVTKITGPLPALIKLYDEGKIDLDKPFSFYWEDFKNTNKEDILFRDILAHQGRLAPWIPYWKNTINNRGNFKWFTFKDDRSKRYPVKVANNLYLHRRYKKKIFKAIRKSELLDKKEYKYSGLANYLYPDIIEDLTGKNYENYLDNNFYQRLGAYKITYNPVNTFNNSNIIPTENDTFFRKQQIQGKVHDEGAVMMGGVSGNAGLFATANDLAKLMQMYLNMGTYGGERYFSDTAMKEFTRCHFPDNDNHRGLGFDKPLLNNDELPPDECYPAKNASPASFGHSGFTGTFTWVDPEENLVYIFLSNRVYPTRENSKIYDLNIRSNILQGIYDAIIKVD